MTPRILPDNLKAASFREQEHRRQHVLRDGPAVASRGTGKGDPARSQIFQINVIGTGSGSPYKFDA
jgi:hypothetical protein